MEKINLSYVLTTRNKLPYLKKCLPSLLKAVQSDEEIVIVDGASSDGTAEYLLALYKNKRIHKFLSEPDRGEAHGLNKATLLAGGELIKFITDDDFYYWPNIQKCKEFMREHPEIDILGTEGVGTNWEFSNPIERFLLYRANYDIWLSNGTPFWFSGLGLMIRRSSLPLLGLMNPGFIWVDMEYTYRATSIPANLVWFTGCTWARLENSSSNYFKYHDQTKIEEDRAKQFYKREPVVNKIPQSVSRIKKIKNQLMFLFFKILHKLFGKNIRHRLFGTKIAPEIEPGEKKIIISRMEELNKWFGLENRQFPGRFLYRPDTGKQ